MIDKSTIKIANFRDTEEFCIEYVENGRNRRVYLPHNVFSTLHDRINEFGRDNADLLCGQSNGN